MANTKQLITFYSYKGGVGRTMALLNTAYQLVRWGHNVLMVDADLEAPGLTLFLKQYLQPTQSGFIEFFEACTQDFIRRFNQDGRIEPLKAEALRAFWENIPTENREKNKTGYLALMPASRIEQYLNHLNRLDIASLYRQGVGYAIAKECQAWLKLMPFDQFPFDYVLIDSRTGYNEASGLCVNALAEALVVVTALNKQNLEGTKQFLTELGLFPDKPIDLVFAISPVPPWQDELTKARLREFQEKFQCSPDVLIPYHSLIALAEENFVDKYSDSEPAHAYVKLAKAILKINRDDADSLFASIRDDIKDEDYSQVLEKLRRAAHQDFQGARSYLSELANRDAPFEWMMDAYQQLADWTNEATTYNDWGIALGALAARKAEAGEAETARRYFQEAFDKYAEAAKMDGAFYEAFYNWGSHLGALAALEAAQQNFEAARNDFEAAFEKYNDAVKLDPQKSEAYQNWAADLTALREMEASIMPNKEGRERYQRFYDQFANVVKNTPE